MKFAIVFSLLLVNVLSVVQAKRIYMSYYLSSLPLMVNSKCGVFRDDQGFGEKGCPEVDLVGNWVGMDLNKEKCETACGWSACIKGSVCTIKNMSDAPIYSVECNPQGNSVPAPDGGFITTYECANEQHIYG